MSNMTIGDARNGNCSMVTITEVTWATYGTCAGDDCGHPHGSLRQPMIVAMKSLQRPSPSKTTPHRCSILT